MINILKKILLISIFLYSKNLIAANFTVDSIGKTISDYNGAVIADPTIGTIIFDGGNGTLAIDQANSSVESIDANGSNNGSIDFTTSSIILDVQNNIADQDQKLSQIISNTDNFTINASNLYANELEINVNTAIAGSAVLNFNNIFLNSANLSLLNQINIFGNITGSGDIFGSSTSLTFDGSVDQNVDSTIGTSAILGNINIAGSNKVSFNDDVTVANINFSNNSAATLDLLGSGKSIRLSKNITNSGSADAFITNSAADGILLISGSSDQNINAKIAVSAAFRLNQIDVENANNQITFEQDSYINILNIKATHSNTTINNNAIMDIATTNINEDAIFFGSGDMTIGDLNIATSKALTLQKIINISGDISGPNGVNTQTIIGSSGGINFRGLAAQSVSDVILGGSSLASNRLISIANSNANDITLNENIYVTDVILNSDGNFDIQPSGTIDIEGDITRMSGSGIIKGTGDVILSGSNAQNININLGESASRINNLEISNSSGVILNNNSYAGSFTYSGNNLTMMSNRNLDIAGTMNLTNKNINFRLSSANSANNPFGKIELNSNNLTLSNSSVFFDYDNLTNSALNFNYDGGSYNIINTGNITDLNNITASDNSYLFNHSLSLDGSNIKTAISKDQDIFNKEDLGEANNQILNNALERSNIAADIMSIGSKSDLENAMESIRLPNSAALLKYNITLNNDINNTISQRVRNISLFPKRNRQSFWGDLFISNMTQSEDKNKFYDGFKSSGSGFLIGYDYINGGSVFGIGGFSSGSEIKNDNQGNFTSIVTSNGLSVYNKFGSKFTKGFYNVNSLNYIINDYENSRQVKLPNIKEDIKSNISGSSMNFRSELGYHIPLVQSSILSPKISLEYFSDTRDSYNETGSDSSAFNVKKEKFSNMIFAAGFDVGGKFYTGKKSLFSPMLAISWRKYVGDSEQSSDISFVNNTEYFNVKSYKLPSDYINIAVNAEYSRSASQFHVNPVFNLKYNAMVADNFISHSFMAEISYNFNSRLMRSSDK